MTIAKKISFSIVILFMTLIIDNFWEYIRQIEGYPEMNSWVKVFTRLTSQSILCFVFTYAILRFTKKRVNILEVLGLNGNIWFGYSRAFLFTLPMLIGYAIIAGLNYDATFFDIFFWSFFSPFTEELIFRGFLFGLLFRFFKIGFFPTLILSSFLFAFGHVHQVEDIISIIQIFAVTFFGGLIFGWLYIEWNYNLWFAIGIHTFMNLNWSLFAIEESNAIGGWGANIFRFMAIALIIFLTIRKIRKDGSHLKGKLMVFSYR
jgi:CAAX protease family protein